MSRKNFYQNVLEFSCKGEEYLNEMDVGSEFDNSELMTSEFFDSVLSLEQSDFMNGTFNSDILENIDDDLCLSSASSSHADEVQSTNSFSSDGDKWTTDPDNITASPHSESIDEDLLMSLFSGNAQEFSENIQCKSPKLVVHNQNTKKVVVSKPYSSNIKKTNFKNKQPLLRVQSGNGRSLLLPFHIANVKSIKILNTNDLKGQNIHLNQSVTTVPIKQETYSISSNDNLEEDDDVDMSSEDCQYPPLNLTTEEKRLLAKDGVQLPTHYPLTKNEERELKRIRRKIRNKISAQDSRKRKKEYVDGLEERVKRGSEENKFLLKRVKQLQQQNSRLVSQMSKLQALVLNSSASKATPTTCLMIVLFSALLVSLPNLGISNSKEVGDQQQTAARRALLFSQQPTNEEDTLNMEEFLLFNKDEEELENVEAEDNINATEKVALANLLNEISQKYNIPPDKVNCSEKIGGIDKLTEYCNKYENEIKAILNNMKDFFGKEEVHSKIDYGGVINKNGFIEPDIDDYPDPGGKRKILSIDDDFRAKQIKLDLNENFITAATVEKGAFIKNASKKE